MKSIVSPTGEVLESYIMEKDVPAALAEWESLGWTGLTVKDSLPAAPAFRDVTETLAAVGE